MSKGSAAAVMRVIRSTAESAATGPSDRDLLRRFAAGEDQAAFAALVRRHGPLVLGVCRRVLPNLQDAEDACQATFLVLAQKAKSRGWQRSIANWLYAAARKGRRKRPGGRSTPRTPRKSSRCPGRRPAVDQMTGRELLATLDEELDKLPPRYREPLLLCYLEGLTRDEAAHRLHIPAATLKTRLERGRKRLGDALTRRGCVVGAGLLALAATSLAGASPSVLVRSVLTAVTQSPPAGVVALTKGVAVNGLMTKSLLLALVLVGTAALGAGAGLAPLTVAGRQQNKAMPARPSEQPVVPIAKHTPADDNTVAFSGQVVAPDGRPVAGAKLYLTEWWGYHFEPSTSPESATSSGDGRFAFTAPKAKYAEHAAIVSATAPNFGVGLIGIRKEDKRTDLTVKLVSDNVPITGQIVDLEVKPVAGATLRLLQVMASPDESLDAWLKEAMVKSAPPRNRSTDLEQKYLERFATAPQTVVTTDDAGRFRLTGIGRERLAIVQLDGPNIVSQHLRIRTRPGESFDVPWMEADREYGHARQFHTYYGSDFRHAAGPTRPIVGVVRDKDTKKPLAGVTVQCEKVAHNPIHGRHIVHSTTDAEGRYRLVGMPPATGNKIRVMPPADMPYVSPTVEVPGTNGADPVTVDVELKRGVWIEGRLTDQATGQPLRGSLMYVVDNDNANADDYLRFYGGMPGVATKDDGTYRIIGLPGPGQVVVWSKDNYLRGADHDDEDAQPDGFGYMPGGNFGAFARVNPSKGAESVRRDLTLIPGWKFSGTIVGPDDKPLSGVRACGLTSFGWWDRAPLMAAEFTIGQFNPRKPRPLLFRHPEKGLIGVAEPPKENGGTVTVRMTPGAVVTGRLLDADGEPLTRGELHLSFRLSKHAEGISYVPEPFKPDAAGRFRIDALLPGYDYTLSVGDTNHRFGKELRAGETTDLGDVRIKRE
jgi:RNA polymerase sigma factor (sigma-70 family)